jgi:hypothetical protein
MPQKHTEGRRFEGGSQPVQEHRAVVPADGRTVGQYLIIAISVLVVLAAVFWIVVPLAAR